MPRVQLPEFTQHYLEQGTGDVSIVFVHGFISTSSWWIPALAGLPRADYHAYALDLRACGQSDAIATGHTLATYSEDLEHFAEQMGLRQFVLVGHSMGGGVAMRYALDHQERLSALVLVDPLAPAGTSIDEPTTAWINAQQGVPDGIRMLTLGAFATPPTGAYLEQLVDEGVRWGNPIYLGTMDDMAHYNVVERLPEITVPTLVTWGDKDTVVPFSGIVDVFTKVPGCALEIWHGVGHSGPIEIPERFTALLTGFIRESRTPQA
jgi:branched-chain amino acid transport system permease protein